KSPAAKIPGCGVASAMHSANPAKWSQSWAAPLFAVDLLSLLNAAEISKRFTASVGGRHAFAQVQFSRHLQVRTQLIVHVVLQTAAAEERSETLDNTSEGRAHKLRSP